MEPGPSPEETRDALERILASEPFRGARRSADLLRYVVESALRAPGQPIKEYALGAEGLGRGEKFDPRFDPIARVEASRLRSRLGQYYLSEGAADAIRIDLPKGGYLPVFIRVPADLAPAGQAAPGRQRILLAALAASLLLLLVTGGLLLSRRVPSVPTAPSLAVESALGAPGVLADQVGNPLALSPDGKTLVMQVLLADGTSRLFVRPLNQLEAKELPGTTGAAGPAFSRDGQWVSFTVGDRIQKIRADGASSPVILGRAPEFIGQAWTEDGYILGTPLRRNTLVRLPAAGGKVETVLKIDPSMGGLSWVSALPNEKGLVYAFFDARLGQGRIEASRMDGSGRVPIAPSGSYPRYAAGHVFYADRATLYAVPFDPDALTALGKPQAVVHDLGYNEFGYAFYTVSNDGLLVYLRSNGSGLSVISQLGEDGSAVPLLKTPGRYLIPRMSPNGRQVAYSIADPPSLRMHMLAVATGETTAFGGSDVPTTFPVWTPDSRRLVYAQGDAVYWREADGSGTPQRLLKPVALELASGDVPRSLTGKGDRIAYHHMNFDTHFDIWTAPITYGPDGPEAGEPAAFISTSAVETYPAFSPDGRWLSYCSNENGDFELFVTDFPDRRQRLKIPLGGRFSAWSATEIFYTTNDHRLMSMPWSVKDGRLEFGALRQWSTQRLSDTGIFANFDLAPDGKSVIALTPGADDPRRPRDHFTVITDALAARGSADASASTP